jgi:hypothetical protein
MMLRKPEIERQGTSGAINLVDSLKRWLDDHPPDDPYFICGDDAYLSKAGIVTPHSQPQNQPISFDCEAFNFVHSSTRQCIERALGLLYARFGRLRHGLDKQLLNCYTTITAACIVHNLAIDRNENEGWAGLVADEAEWSAVYAAANTRDRTDEVQPAAFSASRGREQSMTTDYVVRRAELTAELAAIRFARPGRQYP